MGWRDGFHLAGHVPMPRLLVVRPAIGQVQQGPSSKSTQGREGINGNGNRCQKLSPKKPFELIPPARRFNLGRRGSTPHRDLRTPEARPSAPRSHPRMRATAHRTPEPLRPPLSVQNHTGHTGCPVRRQGQLGHICGRDWPHYRPGPALSARLSPPRMQAAQAPRRP